MSDLDDLEEINLGVSSHGSSAKRSRRTLAYRRATRERTASAPKWQRQLRGLRSAAASKARRER